MLQLPLRYLILARIINRYQNYWAKVYWRTGCLHSPQVAPHILCIIHTRKMVDQETPTLTN